ncbi:MAG: SEC-C metal-binding domain-containing protein, partial [Candidatus Pacebacteria bacterium]|nr:SEC-C metal-binding domain-containing protein [Candidatus Paceibacterota bacterium]
NQPQNLKLEGAPKEMAKMSAKRDNFDLVREKTKDESGKTVGRNDPCPCGSGKKFKKCCGQ